MPNDDTPQSPVRAQAYAAGVEARMSAQREEKRRGGLFPNLAEAAMTHDGRSDPQTLSDIAAQQRADAQEPQGEARPRGLRPETIAGLEDMRRENDRIAAQTAPAPEPVTEAEAPLEPVDDELPADATSEDAALVTAIRQAREQMVVNERERKAVARRVTPIDLAKGLVDGQFTQRVPVVPDKLVVTYRCLTSNEYDALRLYLIGKVRDDPRLGELSQSLLSFYQTVASVVKLNETSFAPHMTQSEGGVGSTFNDKAFEVKVRRFADFPAVLNAQLNMHGVWFEQRVRDLFTTAEPLKNG